MAGYLSGKKLVLKDGHGGELLNVFNYFDKVEKDAYMIGQFWVELLIKEFGKDKFLKLIKNLPLDFNSDQFAERFHNIYEFEFNRNSLKKYLD